nr:septum formation initiator family protein [Alkalibaculum sporogenes]
MLLLLVVLTGYFLINIISVEIQYYKLENQKNNLEIQLSQEKDKLEQLDNELEQIGSDNYVEMLARKYFGLVYPQEKVIIEVDTEKK